MVYCAVRYIICNLCADDLGWLRRQTATVLPLASQLFHWALSDLGSGSDSRAPGRSKFQVTRFCPGHSQLEASESACRRQSRSGQARGWPAATRPGFTRMVCLIIGSVSLTRKDRLALDSEAWLLSGLLRSVSACQCAAAARH